MGCVWELVIKENDDDDDDDDVCKAIEFEHRAVTAQRPFWPQKRTKTVWPPDSALPRPCIAGFKGWAPKRKSRGGGGREREWIDTPIFEMWLRPWPQNLKQCVSSWFWLWTSYLALTCLNIAYPRGFFYFTHYEHCCDTFDSWNYHTQVPYSTKFLSCDCMQCNARYCCRNSVCLSICHKLNDALWMFWYHTKGQSLCYSDTNTGCWATPLPSKICAQGDPSPSKNADFDRFPLITSRP